MGWPAVARSASYGGHPSRINERRVEAPPGFEPGMEVLQLVADRHIGPQPEKSVRNPRAVWC